MNTIQNTNKVTAQHSNSTSRTIVKVSRVTYGHIEGKELILTRNCSDMVMHSLNCFTTKNNLSIKF